MTGFLLLSDVHLEKKSAQAAELLLGQINQVIADERALGETAPLVILAGDIHNGLQGHEWMSRIDAQVLYVAGNHEFWGGDYYDIQASLQNIQAHNVEYLHNRVHVVGDVIFLGATLWTDVAQHLNPDLSERCAFVMNDSLKITACAWYDNPDNLLRLAHLTPRWREFADDKAWNVLIEREENEKTQRFYRAFHVVSEFLKSCAHDKTDVKPLARAYLDLLMAPRLQDSQPAQPSLRSKSSPHAPPAHQPHPTQGAQPACASWEKPGAALVHEHAMGNEFVMPLFDQLCHTDIKKKKVVVISHHLPFMEELLVGNHRSPKLLNPVNEKLFLISQGQDYPDANYFWHCSKGYYPKQENIPVVAHYCNSGSQMWDSGFISMVHTWVHGHEHHYNFCDHVKGIQIATNPMGHEKTARLKKVLLQGVGEDEVAQSRNDEHDNNDEKNNPYNDMHADDQGGGQKSLSVLRVKAWCWFLCNKKSYMDACKAIIETAQELSTDIENLDSEAQDNASCLPNPAPHRAKTMAHLVRSLNALVQEFAEHDKELAQAISVRLDPKYSYRSASWGVLESEEVLQWGLEKIEASHLQPTANSAFELSGHVMHQLQQYIARAQRCMAHVKGITHVLGTASWSCAQEIPGDIALAIEAMSCKFLSQRWSDVQDA